MADSPKELALQLQEAQEKLNDLKALTAEAQKEFDRLRFSVIPDALNELGVSSLNLPGIGRLGLTEDMRVSLKAGNREEGYEWMRENGYADLVVETVHSSTLKAWAKEQFKKGVDLPDLFELDPYQRASLTKR